MNQLAVFKGKNTRLRSKRASAWQVRRILHNKEWWFSIIDVVEALTESPMARRYWTDLKRRLAENEGFSELYAKCVQLKLESSDGKKYETDCATAETLFRIIQSIPSPKADADFRPPLEGGHAHFFSERGGVSIKQQRSNFYPSRLAMLRLPSLKGRAKNPARNNGGKIAGDARNQLEKQTGRRVVSKQTYLAAKVKRVK